MHPINNACSLFLLNTLGYSQTAILVAPNLPYRILLTDAQTSLDVFNTNFNTIEFKLIYIYIFPFVHKRTILFFQIPWKQVWLVSWSWYGNASRYHGSVDHSACYRSCYDWGKGWWKNISSQWLLFLILNCIFNGIMCLRRY